MVSMAIIVLLADGWLVLIGLTFVTGLLILDVSMAYGTDQFSVIVIVCPKVLSAMSM